MIELSQTAIVDFSALHYSLKNLFNEKIRNEYDENQHYVDITPTFKARTIPKAMDELNDTCASAGITLDEHFKDNPIDDFILKLMTVDYEGAIPKADQIFLERL